MFTFIACLLAYYVTIRFEKHVKARYMKINNVTSSEYDDIIKEKMKTYTPYDPNEVILA